MTSLGFVLALQLSSGLTYGVIEYTMPSFDEPPNCAIPYRLPSLPRRRLPDGSCPSLLPPVKLWTMLSVHVDPDLVSL